jgi:hypothetical protein
VEASLKQLEKKGGLRAHAAHRGSHVCRPL